MPTYGPFYPSAVTSDGYANHDGAKQPGVGVATYSGSAGDGRELHASGFGSIVPAGMRLKQITLAVEVAGMTHSGVTQPAIDSLQLEQSDSLLADPELHGAGIAAGPHEATIYDLDIGDTQANLSTFGVGFVFFDALGETATGTFSLSIDCLYIKSIVCE